MALPSGASSKPRSTREKLDVCLIETQMASTGWRKLKASLSKRFLRS
jgi:hypothetical protein